MPSPVNPYNPESNTIVFIKYDSKITRLISKQQDTFALGASANADELLASFFEKYPQVFEKAVPGTLLHKINGAIATPAQPLQTGDFVEFGLMSLAALRRQIKKEIDSLSNLYDLGFSSQEVASYVFESQDDNPDKFLLKFLPETILQKISEEEWLSIENALFKAWASLPRRKFKGKSQMQILHKDLMKELISAQNEQKSKLKGIKKLKK